MKKSSEEIVKELFYKGILIQDGCCYINGKKNDKPNEYFNSLYKNLKKYFEEEKSNFINFMLEIQFSSQKNNYSYFDDIFVNSVKDSFNIYRFFDDIKDSTVISLFRDLCNTDISKISLKDKIKIIEYGFSLQWIVYLSINIRYINYLLSCIKDNFGVDKFAAGLSGPMSNVDLPMKERVFEWNDIAEEVAGREKDKKTQARYRMGHENRSSWPSPGFYFREIRNEPFAINDPSGTPYPRRNLLWKS